LEDLAWQEETYREEEELYRMNQEEQKHWFDEGIIRETDYLDARTNYLLAVNRVLSARIDRRLYNLELKALFVSPENS
jgi:outer membrane protein TolC